MLYGKWRPRGFDEVVGQDHVVTTIRNALATGQLAHAYLFSGPRGTGKTTTARILARAMNCSSPVNGEPCDACPSCEAIAAGNALDLIEMDAASNRGIDDIRQLREKIAFAPSDLARKVYLLDEVHMLTDGAWNALLKTLEEPPPHAYFILATTELHEVPATVLSRCQRFDFHRVANTAIVERLRYICEQEGYTLDDESLSALAVQSRGGLWDAITLLEQVVARFDETPARDDVLGGLGLLRDHRTGDIVEAILGRDLAAALDTARDVAESGVDIKTFTRGVIEELRERLNAVAHGEEGDLEQLISAITELSGADFRLDPGNPVPLELACASAILGPRTRAAAPAPEPETARPSGERAKRSPQPRRGNQGGADAAAADNETPEQRFLRQLYNRCKMVNIRASAWLNDTCEVISIDDDAVRLGFFMALHRERIENDFRDLVEQEASQILGRTVRIETEVVERSQGSRRQSRGGHLVAAAREYGATPIGKEDE